MTLSMSARWHFGTHLQAFEQPGNGRVLVVDGGGSKRCALLGDNIAEMAHKNGWSVSVARVWLGNTAHLDGTRCTVLPLRQFDVLLEWKLLFRRLSAVFCLAGSTLSLAHIT